ncbi:MAG: hypothetical protein RL685_134 [Pseudomonadota bacterium]
MLIGTKGSLSSQIEAELSGLGFRVLTREAGAALETPRELQAAAREAGAEAAVSVQPSTLGVDVWLVDRVTGKTLSREVVQTGPGSERERVIAVRVVELLRASLLELQLPSGAEGEVQATPQLQALVGLPNPRVAQAREPAPPAPPAASGYGVLRIEAGWGVSSSVGATSVTPFGTLGALWQPTQRLAIGITSFLPLASADVSAREGSTSIATWEVIAGPRLYPLATTGPIRPFVDLGLALMWFQIDATRAEAPLRASSERLLTAGANAGLGVDWQLSSHFSLYSTAGASIAAAKPVVQFAGRDVLTLARPLLFWTLGIEVRATSEASRDW